MKYIILMLISLLMGSNCMSQEDINWDFEDELLLIEGEYLLSGRFGNVVIYNPFNKEKEWVTLDSKYDETPFFSDSGKSIIFSSIRGNNGRFSGLSGDNDIYIYEREKKKLSTYFDEPKAILPNLLYSDPDVRSVLYVELQEERYKLITDNEGLIFDQESFKTGVHKILSLYVSPNNNHLLYNYFRMTSNGIFPTLSFHDSSNKKTSNFLKEYKINEMELSEIPCFPGSFITNTIVYFSCTHYKKKKSNIYQYNYESKEVDLILESNQLSIDNPNSKGKGDPIYFIARPFSNEDDENIWMYDLKSKKLKQITFSHTNKDWLRVRK